MNQTENVIVLREVTTFWFRRCLSGKIQIEIIYKEKDVGRGGEDRVGFKLFLIMFLRCQQK